jgi:hypothetical protein
MISYKVCKLVIAPMKVGNVPFNLALELNEYHVKSLPQNKSKESESVKAFRMNE